EKLKDDYQLKETDNVSIEESVAIFLNICAQNATQRYVGKIFGHSQETISRKFHEVLSALEKMAVDLLRPGPNELTQPHPRLQSNRNYWPYFKGFIGAIDRTHVPVTIAGKDSEKYWNRKSDTSINVLAICNMDMLSLVRPVVIKKCLTNDILRYDLLLKGLLVCGKENGGF
ncbi:unnamed protein product, partial [Brassica napus]